MEEEDDEGEEEEMVVVVGVGDEESSSLPLLAIVDADVGDASPAIGPTLMVVVEVGGLGESWSQLNIIAAMAPLIRPLQ